MILANQESCTDYDVITRPHRQSDLLCDDITEASDATCIFFGFSHCCCDPASTFQGNQYCDVLPVTVGQLYYYMLIFDLFRLVLGTPGRLPKDWIIYLFIAAVEISCIPFTHSHLKMSSHCTSMGRDGEMYIFAPLRWSNCQLPNQLGRLKR